MPPSLLRRLPLILILASFALGAVFLRDYLSFDALVQNREALLSYRDAHYGLTAVVFAAAYFAIVALSLPGATIATLTGGFLFGLFSGALAVFLAARAGLGAEVAARIAAKGGAAARLLAGLQKNVWPALFTMRLIPAIPFFLSNLLPAFAGVGFVPFAVTTYLGIIPGALVFTSVGAGLAEVFAAGGSPDMGIIFKPAVLLPLFGLAALSALPNIIRAFTRKEA